MSRATPTTWNDAPWLWLALLTGLSVLLSAKLSCATPFAALATLAALQLKRTDGLILIGLVWLANQAVGYAFLNYPHDVQSYSWGLAIGAGALAALFAAEAIAAATLRVGSFARAALTLAGAFAAYEIVVFAATAVLPATDEAFSLAVVAQIGLVNALVLPGALLLHTLAVGFGLVSQTERTVR
jgi:hypothetical protein